MSRRRSGRAGGVAFEAALAALLLVLPQACASAPRAIGAATGPREGARGYRALFRGAVEGPDGRSHFRMAAALLFPDRLRFEFFGPVGGPRLVVAIDGTSVLAMIPGDRVYDRGKAEPEALERLIGLPLTPAQVVSLLTATPMCDPEISEQQVRTRMAVAFARTVAWFEIACPPDEIRYEARSAERGGILKEASVREGIGGAMILAVEYDDHEEGQGPRWPRRIRLRLARKNTTVELVAVDGPSPDDVPADIFAPPVPDGFEKRALLASLPAPGLLGSTAGRER